MKVLIVDDNVAIREIIAEILTTDGCEIVHASTIEDAEKAIEDEHPEVTILDSVIGGESTINFATGLPWDCGTRIIFVVGGKESLPKDNPLIVGSIKKPFKSTEILDAVRGQREDVSEPEKKPAPKSKEKKPRFKFLSSFGKHDIPEIPEESDDHLIRFGKSYLVFESEPLEVYTVAQQFIPQGCDIFIITSDRVKTVSDRMGDENIKVLGLSQRAKVGCVEFTRLGTLMAEIMKFINDNIRPVVVIDDLNSIIEANELNLSLTMVYQILSCVEKRFTVVMSVDESRLTDKDKNLLFKYMEQYKPVQEDADPKE